ncbi:MULTISPECIES: aspartate/glutamate racemase family protein [Calothrix]|uniref:Aspartate/glutamate racemase family protein n=2 Tax=Calothrix TaxID=1186 RepID=A0ABR8A8R7_9CYAN|nr:MULTISPECIES: amino acid racemase [Calothrix]MBD2195446.1 aspartate/glutamate racemase family protein [Calothrix parietina FACHB-288]MBD2223108.1 aspartate/glutamate racemase family protein [Calothrix anomala FACHB-343]
MLGILGGMGPLASAEFVKTIYDYNVFGNKEQDAPRVILNSNPTIPDRTSFLLKGDYDLLLLNLIESTQKLDDLQVSKIIICCVTSHYLLPYFPQKLKDKIISLVDVCLLEVWHSQSSHLLLCTNGTRQLNVFQTSELWPMAEDYIIFPDDKDQIAIHNMIYQMKVNKQSFDSAIIFLKYLINKYHVSSVISGCTEIHLLNRYIHNQNYQNQEDITNDIFLDPLMIVASRLEKFLCNNDIIFSKVYS